jgi:hypothetical protein
MSPGRAPERPVLLATENFLCETHGTVASGYEASVIEEKEERKREGERPK